MANETIQMSYNQKDPQVDGCSENIPPESTDAASKLQAQLEIEARNSSMQHYEDNSSVSDSCTFSMPLEKGSSCEAKAKSRPSGSTLTPVLKCLNVGNEYPTPELLRHRNRLQLSPPLYAKRFSTGKGHKSAGEFGRFDYLGESPVSLIEDECLPEVTLFDLTYLQMTTNESVLPECTPAKSSLCHEVEQADTSAGEKDGDSLKLPEQVATKGNVDANDKMDEITPKNKSAPISMGILETEITLLDVSHNSEVSPAGQMSSMDILQVISPRDHLKVNPASFEVSGQSVEDSNTVTNEDLSCTSVQSVKCVTESIVKTSLEGTRDITMGSILENSKSSSETSGQRIDTSEDKVVSVTLDLSSLGGTSAQGAHVSTSVSNGVTSEVQFELTENSEPVETESEEVQTSCDSKSTSEVSQQSPKSAASGNSTFEISQPSGASPDYNTSASVSCPENKTLDLPDVKCSMEEHQARDETLSITSCVINQNCSSGKDGVHCVEECTFDKSTLQQGAASACFKNNTFDCKALSQNNATITLSGNASSQGPHNTLDVPTSPKVCNFTATLKDGDCEDQSELLGREAATASDLNAKNHTFDPSPGSKSVSGGYECKDLSHSEPPLTDALSSSSNNQSVDAASNKTSTFDLDDTLDLRADFMITSTPMTSCKMFNTDAERETDSIPAVQKKLYKDDPSKSADQATSQIPSNIVCDRKTFLNPSAAKNFHPPSKAASQLLKNKPGSFIPGMVTTGLPVKRSRIDPVKKASASEQPQGTTRIKNSYSLRSLTEASKLPSSGLQRPQHSGIPLGIPRPASGFKPSSARVNAFAASSTDKSFGPAVTNTSKHSQGKKHLLPKEDTLPLSKRKKTDTLASSSNTGSTASVCDSTKKVKTLKAAQKSKTQRNDAAAPASTAESSTSCGRSSRVRALKPRGLRAPQANPQNHGCAKCSELEKELKLKSEEIKRLKEELLKYTNQKDG